MKEEASSISRLTGKGVFPPKYAFTLLLPIRNIFISPRKLIDRLSLQKDSIVLEVGPGPGYFSAEVAKELSCGKLFLADIQQEMLDYAKRRLTKKKITNVEYQLCNGKSLPFSSNMFDIIFMVTVLGEIENREEYLREFSRVLRDGGTISVSEQAGDPDKLEITELINLFQDFGFKFDRLYGSVKNFTINFRKTY